jgi:hypothetical protein
MALTNQERDELGDIRNRWAHHEVFTTDDAYRALGSAKRLLKAVSARPCRTLIIGSRSV